MAKNQSDEYYVKTFEKCYRIYFHRVRSFIFYYLNDYDMSKNIAQEVFVAVWENRHKIRFEEEIISYLLQVAKRKSLNYIDKQRARERYESFSLNHSRATLDYTALSHNSSTSIYTKEIAHLTQKALNSLPKATLETYLLSKEKKMKYSEIASMLNISVKTVEYRISSTFKVLRHHLKDYLPTIIGFIIPILLS